MPAWGLNSEDAEAPTLVLSGSTGLLLTEVRLTLQRSAGGALERERLS